MRHQLFDNNRPSGELAFQHIKRPPNEVERTGESVTRHLGITQMESESKAFEGYGIIEGNAARVPLACCPKKTTRWPPAPILLAIVHSLSFTYYVGSKSRYYVRYARGKNAEYKC